MQQLSEYLGKIPGADNKKFMKMLVFGKNGPAIYNISDIKISSSIGEGKAAETEDPKVVRIIYTGDESSKVMKMKTFANYCKKILDVLKDVDEKEVLLEAALDGREDKGHSFRFYYDNSKNFAVLVKNANVEGIEKFLESYDGDLEEAVSLPKTRAIAGGKSKKQKDPSWKDDYMLVDVSDSCGHKIRMWKRKDMM